MNKRGLGKGLQALLPESKSEENSNDKIIDLPIKSIKPNRKQPRQFFDEDKLKELGQSIKTHGVVQPIIVRKIDNQKYELVAGERRLRACKLVGINKIPALVKDFTEKEISEIALIENLQRENLNPIEEANAFKTLMDEYGFTQEELAKRVGKSRPFIANSLRLLSLPDKVKQLVKEGVISSGHARTLISITDVDVLEEVVNEIISKGLSVRQTEKLVKKILDNKEGKPEKKKTVDPNLSQLVEMLQKRLSTKVYLKQGKNGGKIEIEYYGDEELQRLMEIIIGEFQL